MHSHTDHPATFHKDVDGGFLPGALLQADIASHVKRLSPGNVQSGHPNSFFLSPHLRTVLSLPLHVLLTLATQVEGCVELGDKVGAGRGDSGLCVAYNWNEGIANIPNL